MNALIDGVEVFLAENPAFTYNFYDFIDPTKVKGHAGTTLRIVPTVEAQRVLGGATMSEIRSKVHTLQIGEQGSVYWQSQVRVDAWSETEITLIAVGGNASWMEAAKALRLRDLDLGSTETITAEVQRASWTDPEQLVYYPLIDYGRLEDRANSFDVPVGDLRPALRVWPLIKRGFEQIGFTIKAGGRFERLSKMLVLPSVSGEVYANAATRALATTVVQIPAGFSVPVVGSQTSVIPVTWTVVSDPSSSFSGNVYTQPFAQALRPVIDIDATLTGTVGALRVNVIGPLGTVFSSSQINPTESPAGTRIYDIEGFALPVAINPLGQQYRVELTVVYSPGSNLTVNRLVVRWEPEEVYYQSGVQIDINTVAPKDLTLAQLITGIGSLLNVRYTTDDLTGIVRAEFYDDMLKPIEQGRDFRGRENFDPVPVKEAPNTPTRYLFRYEADSKDRDVIRINESYRSPGWGNKDEEVGGLDDEVKVNVPFAPTAMGPILETLYGPLMRNVDAAFQTNELSYKPRILLADGVVSGGWTHDGDALEVYPKTFSIWPGDTRFSLDFANNTWAGTAAPGTVAQYYANYLRRAKEAYTLGIFLRLDDDELLSLDLTRPVMVSDGVNDGWYYITKVENKQFGTDAFTRCELLQV